MTPMACLLLLALGDPLLAPAPAQDPAASASEPLRISLDDAIDLARLNNLSLAGARLDAEGAVDAFNSAWGAFDTIFFTNAFWSNGRDPPQATFVDGVPVGLSPASEQELVTARSGFRGSFLTGTSWTFSTGPQKNTFNDVSQFSGDWVLELTHPLLRNGADDYTQSGLELAAHDATIATLSAETAATDTLQAVVVAYWNLLFARADLKTRELSVELASELLDITRRKFEQGLQNRINVTEVEAELAARRQELLTAVAAEANAEDVLRRLVLAPESSRQWDRPIELLTEPAPAEQRTIDVEAAVATALQFRADVAASRESLLRADVDVRRARNQTRPLLDVTGGYGINSDEQNYEDSLTSLDDTTYSEARVGFSFEVPIGNRGAGYELRRAQVARERAGVDLREVEMTAFQEVRLAAREVETQIARVAATAETARLQQEVYDGEVRRLENDLSTPFQVRQTQRDLFAAIDAAKRAKLDLEVARSALLQAQGRLPYAYGMERSLPELSISERPPAP
ncbi:MAG TPA: TolC family protein [Planctomycetota bacterium]|nr:TolC family protein [Planctomycetota bacterium]